jgi:hypothetical protein
VDSRRLLGSYELALVALHDDVNDRGLPGNRRSGLKGRSGAGDVSRPTLLRHPDRAGRSFGSIDYDNVVDVMDRVALRRGTSGREGCDPQEANRAHTAATPASSESFPLFRGHAAASLGSARNP